MRTAPKTLLALTTAAFMALAALSLARVDTNLGHAYGPDRRMRLLDAATATYPGRDRIARAVLADRPLDGRAYRVLAVDRMSTGQGADARALLDIAVRRWPRDAATRALLADRALALGDVDTGLEHLDALLRVAPYTRDAILPLLVPHLGDPRVRDALIARLALDPPWREALATQLRADNANAADVEALLASLSTHAPLTPEEQRTRIAVLDRAGQPARARALWLSTLEATARKHAGLVFDGGFEAPDVSGGYGWHFAAAPGLSIEHDANAPYAGTYSLALRFSGRAIAFSHVTQPLALTPGEYRFAAAARDDTGSTRPFAWRIACSDGRALADVPIDARFAWQRQQAMFEVPAACARQTLTLRHTSRSLAERQLQNSVYIDALGIFPRR